MAVRPAGALGYFPRLVTGLQFPTPPTTQSTLPLDLEFARPARFKLRASGEVTLGEVERAIEAMVAHPELTHGTDVLIDASEVEGVPSTPELRSAARALVPLLDKGLVAVCVVSHNPFIYGVARMFSVFAEAVGVQVGAFREFDGAHRWLTDRRGAVSAPQT